MSERPPLRANVFPKLYYDDAAAAIDWLVRAFGFRKRLVVPGPDGTVRHAELTLDGGVLFVGTSRPEQKCVSPRRLDGTSHVLCIHVADPESHLARARAAGARIHQELQLESNGGRAYGAVDPEGNHWHFSDYLPGAFWTE